MNKVNVNSQETVEDYRVGDIFIDTDSMEIYILAKNYDTKNTYTCICLNDGMNWNDPTNNIQQATHNLEFVGRHVTINILTDVEKYIKSLQDKIDESQDKILNL